ncbi:MAG: GNAT family N-acetyltransferase [Bacteroidales bacterium]|nr:GNAT family N-acetyltransferase [Bacteroidales bacterium]
MKLSKYGIDLILLKEEEIELVRQWRNHPSVVSNYEYREYITPEMQREWFKTINNIHNLYFIVEYKGEKMGVVNAKNIDWENQTFESGIFIPEGKYSNTFIPAMISIMTMELGFRLFGWFKGYAHVLKTNKPVQSMIRSVGYTLCDGQEDVENQLYEVTFEKFLQKAEKLIRAMHTVTGGEEGMTVTIFREDFQNEMILKWEEIGKKNADVIRVEEVEEGRIYYLK